MEQFLEIVLSKEGIFAFLFVSLLAWVLKTTGDRERKLQEIISQLTEKLGILQDIKEDVKDLKNRMF